MATSHHSITQLLVRWRNGDQTALNELMPLVYDEMRRLAHHYMRREQAGHTLQTAALINEAYLRLVDHKEMNWQNRAHFLGVAAQAMRHVLVDYARARMSTKRGGNFRKVDFSGKGPVVYQRAEELMALDEALDRLAAVDPRKAQIVELRYFGGLSVDETAKILEISAVTVMRDWRAAKAFLLRELSRPEAGTTRTAES